MKVSKNESQASTTAVAEEPVAQIQQEPTRGGCYIRTPADGKLTPAPVQPATQQPQE